MKSFPFGSNLGQAGDWDGFGPIWEVIIWGHLDAFIIAIRRFCNFYAAKTADFVVGVSGFEPEASWTRIRSGIEKQEYCVHCVLLTAYLQKVPNYCVHAVQPLLSRSGSGFGSAKFTVPPKSEFWKLLKTFSISRAIIKDSPTEILLPSGKLETHCGTAANKRK